MNNVIIVLLLAGFLALYFSIRKNLVFRFTKWLNQRCCDIVIDYISSCGVTLTKDEMKNYKYLNFVWDSIKNISYTKMLFSFKPLKPKYWLTKEQQDFLNLYVNS